MIWVGLDLHKRLSRMRCFDPATGEVRDLGSVANDASALEEALEELLRRVPLPVHLPYSSVTSPAALPPEY